MSRFSRVESLRPDRRLVRFALGATIAIGLALGGALGAAFWPHLIKQAAHLPRFDRSETMASPSGQPLIGRYRVDVLYVIDGDTFEARVHVAKGDDFTSRVRLRRVDAPEMKARCAEERAGAERALEALRTALADREVAIWNIGSDKYGRIVADVGTRRAPDISAVLLAQGVVRPYDGGHRDGWC
jgi:endonuclease YncB( thermonuclease family)